MQLLHVTDFVAACDKEGLPYDFVSTHVSMAQMSMAKVLQVRQVWQVRQVRQVRQVWHV